MDGFRTDRGRLYDGLWTAKERIHHCIRPRMRRGPAEQSRAEQSRAEQGYGCGHQSWPPSRLGLPDARRLLASSSSPSERRFGSRGGPSSTPVKRGREGEQSREQNASSEFADSISIVRQSAIVRLSHRVSLRAIVGTGLESAPGPGKAGSPRPPSSLP